LHSARCSRFGEVRRGGGADEKRIEINGWFCQRERADGEGEACLEGQEALSVRQLSAANSAKKDWGGRTPLWLWP
jgi:hypothetical protein